MLEFLMTQSVIVLEDGHLPVQDNKEFACLLPACVSPGGEAGEEG